MMNWLYYLLEANLYLAVFYGFYRLFLHRETFYNINRYFLLLATLLSFVLPMLKVGTVISLLQQPASATMVVTKVELEEVKANAFVLPDLQNVIYIVYLGVAAVLLLRTLMSLGGIFRIYFKAQREKIDDVVYVELDQQHSAFSFFNILFISPNVSERRTVIKHEMIHIKQNHSADVLFFEFIHIISWFSPIVFLIKQDIKLLHEYIADELTTATDIHKHDYALFLIENSFGILPAKLTNQIFNQSLIKRRIKMMNKEKSGNLAKYRLLLLAPITIGLLCGSTMAFAKEYAILDLMPQATDVLQQDTGKLKYQKIENIKITGKSFYPHFRVNKSTKNAEMYDQRLILINGKGIKKDSPFGMITNCTDIKELSAAAATKKYGERGRYGAVELSGPDIVVVKDVPPPPPPMEPSVIAPPKVEVIKFPKPKSAAGQKNKLAAPKIEVIKFPPPKVEKKANK